MKKLAWLLRLVAALRWECHLRKLSQRKVLKLLALWKDGRAQIRELSSLAITIMPIGAVHVEGDRVSVTCLWRAVRVSTGCYKRVEEGGTWMCLLCNLRRGTRDRDGNVHLGIAMAFGVDTVVVPWWSRSWREPSPTSEESPC